MKIGIMQPYFLPYIGYFQLIKAVNKFILFDDVNYIKKGWINRNRIVINEKEFMFIIPLEKVSQNKLINEINITKDSEWKSRLVETFDATFRKAPMYSKVFPVLEEIITKNERNLSAFLTNSLVQICRYLDIKTPIELSSLKYKTTPLKGQDKILNICIQEDADIYFNPIGGTNLYNRKTFEEKGIKLQFLKSLPVIYPRFNGESIPFLSIIDLMMFIEQKRIIDYLSHYEMQ